MYKKSEVKGLIEYKDMDELDLDQVGMGDPATNFVQVAEIAAWVDVAVYANAAVATEGVLLAVVTPSVLS